MSIRIWFIVVVAAFFAVACDTGSAGTPVGDDADAAGDDAGVPSEADEDVGATRGDTAVDGTTSDADVGTPPEDVYEDPCGGVCAAPYPGCAELEGEWRCVPCSEDAHCGSDGQCDPESFTCVVEPLAEACVPGGCPQGTGFDLRCDTESGLCYDVRGLCDDIHAHCDSSSGSRCVGVDELILGSLPGSNWTPEGWYAPRYEHGLCACDTPENAICGRVPTNPICADAMLCPAGGTCVTEDELWLRFCQDCPPLRPGGYEGGFCIPPVFSAGQDDWLRLAGEYEVITTMDLASGLPNGIGDVHFWVFDFFETPSLSVLELLCDVEGEEGVADGLCALAFEQEPDGSRVLTASGETIRGIIDARVAELGGNVGFVWAADPVENPLTNVRLVARFSFAQEPLSGSGELPPGSATALWTSLRYRWLPGCPECMDDPDCGWMESSLSQVSGEPVVGLLTGRVNPEDEAGVLAGRRLTIDPHGLNLRHGALMDYLYREVLLPRLIGGIPADGLPVVDSWAEMLKSYLAGRGCLATEAEGGTSCCEQFRLDALAADPALPAEVLDAGCARLVDAGAARFEELLLGLDSEAGDSWVIGTAPDYACVLIDQDDDGDVDLLNTAEQPSQWSIDLGFVGMTVTLPASFYGLRF